MATLRNLAIGLIRQAGYAKIAATIRKIKHDTALLITVLGLNSPHDQAKRLCGTPWGQLRALLFIEAVIRPEFNQFFPREFM